MHAYNPCVIRNVIVCNGHLAGRKVATQTTSYDLTTVAHYTHDAFINARVAAGVVSCTELRVGCYFPARVGDRRHMESPGR